MESPSFSKDACYEFSCFCRDDVATGAAPSEQKRLPINFSAKAAIAEGKLSNRCTILGTPAGEPTSAAVPSRTEITEKFLCGWSDSCSQPDFEPNDVFEEPGELGWAHWTTQAQVDGGKLGCSRQCPLASIDGGKRDCARWPRAAADGEERHCARCSWCPSAPVDRLDGAEFPADWSHWATCFTLATGNLGWVF